MKKADSCECCIEKATVSGCLACNKYQINNALDNLSKYIIEIEDEIQNYDFYFNRLYEDNISKMLNELNISIPNIVFSTMLEDDKLGVIVHKLKCDWGDIDIRFK